MKLQHFFLNQRNNPNSIRTLALVLVLFLLGYALGFFTSPPSTRSLVHPSTRSLVHPSTDDFFRFSRKCAPPIPQSSIRSTIVANFFNNTSPFEGFPPAHVKPFLQRRHVRGWGSTTPVFESLIRSVKPTIIIEIGTFLGASALHMADITRRHNLPNTVILCLDDFRAWPGYNNYKKGIFKHINGDVVLMQQFMQNVVDAGEADRVLPLPFSTTISLGSLCHMGVYADLIEVDAGHDFHSAWADINLAWKVLKPGGTMFGHDYFNREDNYGVRRAVDLFAKVMGLTVKPNKEHWVLYPPKRA